MNDFFALFDETRRPWLDPELLKKRFLALSATVHPDRVHSAGEAEKRTSQQRYAELNRAYNCLRNPKERLQHLLELERGARPQQVQQVPAELMDFFFQVGQLFKNADSVLTEKGRTSSPLLQVQVFQTAQEWTEKLNKLQQQLKARQEGLTVELKELDARWIDRSQPEPGDKAAILRRVEELYRLFSYFARWESQAQEKIVQLSL